jgi:hypothetical protein
VRTTLAVTAQDTRGIKATGQAHSRGRCEGLILELTNGAALIINLDYVICRIGIRRSCG